MGCSRSSYIIENSSTPNAIFVLDILDVLIKVCKIDNTMCFKLVLLTQLGCKLDEVASLIANPARCNTMHSRVVRQKYNRNVYLECNSLFARSSKNLVNLTVKAWRRRKLLAGRSPLDNKSVNQQCLALPRSANNIPRDN